MKTFIEPNRLIKPINTTVVNNLTGVFGTATASTLGMSPLMSRDPNILLNVESPNYKIKSENEINLVEFTKLYKVGQIPIIDFFMIYIIFYLINSLYLNLDYKIVLVATIPLTIVFNLITNDQCKISNMILLILVMSLYYLSFCLH